MHTCTTFSYAIIFFVTGKKASIQLNFKKIAFGECQLTSKYKTQVKNFIILVTKYLIFFANKYSKMLPTLQGFKPYIYQNIQIEKETAFKKDKIAFFLKRMEKHSEYIYLTLHQSYNLLRWKSAGNSQSISRWDRSLSLSLSLVHGLTFLLFALLSSSIYSVTVSHCIANCSFSTW